MIGLVIRQMNLEQMQARIDGLDETEAPGQKVDGADAAVNHAALALADLVVDVAGGKDRPIDMGQFRLVEPTLQAALAASELLSYFSVHSKFLFLQDQ